MNKLDVRNKLKQFRFAMNGHVYIVKNIFDYNTEGDYYIVSTLCEDELMVESAVHFAVNKSLFRKDVNVNCLKARVNYNIAAVELIEFDIGEKALYLI